MAALGIDKVYPISYVYQDSAATDAIATNNPMRYHNMRVKTFYFADADNAELFVTPPGTVACAWQPSGVTHLGTWSLGATGIVFTSAAGNALGWLHCLCNGTLKTGSTTSEAPVGKGTSGWVNNANGIVLCERGSATPATVTNGKRLPSKAGLKFQIFEVSDTSDNDTWECTTSRLCPGVVAVAWQTNTVAEDVNVTLNAANDVVFNSTAGSADFGWLWVWSR